MRYALCFVFLGIIDQRWGNALGTTQMTFTNLTGLVMVLLILPSIKFEKENPYLLWVNDGAFTHGWKKPLGGQYHD